MRTYREKSAKRTEPTSGEMNYTNILKHIQSKGYTGLIEMEHSVSQPGKAGEEAVLKIYDRMNHF